MIPKFTHLHVHTQYSLLDGLPKIEELLNFVKENGMDSVAITDHGVLYGAVEFYKKAKKAGVKPIIGSEIYTSFEGMTQKRPNIDNKRYHLVLLVKNETGYRNLVKLVTKAHLEGFYYKPRVDEELLFQHTEGLIALSACLQGKIPRLIISNRIDEAEKTALKYQKAFGKENFYLEIQHHPNIPEQAKANKIIIGLSKKHGIPLVATNDCHYLRPEDAEAQDILMLINTGQKSDDKDRLTMRQDDFSVTLPKEIAENFKDVPEAITNTQKIVDACNFEFKLGEIKLPNFQVPGQGNPDEYLTDICEKRFDKRKKEFKNEKEARERLEYELEVIKKTGFASYFLIVADFVEWAKENKIVVGPGRGSIGGSLVAYLANITNINPLQYNLLFERFLNPERISLPDIDLDFADARRDEVIEYVSQKYGQDRVAQIITFGTMAARAAIRDVGRVLKYPYISCDKIAKMIPFGFNLDQAIKQIPEFREAYESDEQIKRLVDLAKKLEGVARHASTHACGVVISAEPLDTLVPVQRPTQSDGNIITQYEMYSIEDLGLLKMDFLGLKNLTMIEDAVKLIEIIRGKKIEIDKIPQDDRKTYKLLQKAETTSIFQMESSGMKKWLRQLQPSKFEDISTMLALYRPGPMQFIPEYIARKQNKKKVEYLHPKLKPILESTYGLPIFQEQMMQIAREIAGFSLSEADILRKAIGKKISSLLNEQKEKFISGAAKQGVEEGIAQKIWGWFLPFAQYGFNKSHSTGYGIIAYQTAYLKANFPVEFMAAVLASEKQDVERIAFLLEECKRMDIDVLPPDINESFKNFTVVDKNKIRFGLLAIKNVGHNIVQTIVDERTANGKYQSIGDFVSRIHSKDLNKKSMESLIKAGGFDKLEERNMLLGNLERLLSCSREIQNNKNNGQKGLFDGSKVKTTINLEQMDPASAAEKLKWEKELLGLFVSGHPLEAYQKSIAKKAVPISKILQELTKTDDQPGFPLNVSDKIFKKIMPGTRLKICGLISRIKKIITKSGRPMFFVKIQDLTGEIEAIIFPNSAEQYANVLQENKIVIVSGRVDFKEDSPKMIVEGIEEIIEE
ncbi:DNA polymerase III subunit alpha [Patescibacteria group bacterium]|nr:DNA polymerase III subunit alpha [Patescibacteria group bacterium]MBU4162241.1 DNA polymerase III subunit alpha [Patescibacteria group bacterium]